MTGGRAHSGMRATTPTSPSGRYAWQQQCPLGQWCIIRAFLLHQAVLGLCYFWSRCGAVQNYVRSFEYFKQAGLAGQVHSQYWMGFLYHNGNGVNKDENLALEWWRKAADQGDVQVCPPRCSHFFSFHLWLQLFHVFVSTQSLSVAAVSVDAELCRCLYPLAIIRSGRIIVLALNPRFSGHARARHRLQRWR